MLVVCLASLASNGCAIHYFDADTGTEHLWGFGHMKVKISPANEGLKAVVRGVDTIGLAAGGGDRDGYFALGWQSRQRLDIVDEDTKVRLEWCGSDFVNIRVGSEFPESLVGAHPNEVHASSEKEAVE